MEISVLKNFSEYPGLRHCAISDNSGEEFYHNVLNSAFKESLCKKEKLIVNLDFTAGYAPSFLDESFGNLVYDFSLDIVKNNLIVVSNQEPYWINRIQDEFYVNWEKRRKDNHAPKITKQHEAWFRLVNNQPELKIWEQFVVSTL